MARREHRSGDKPGEVTLPVTPMLDMAFQLLFFFLCTFSPASQKEGQMDLGLAATPPAAPDRPRDLPQGEPEAVTELTVTLRSYQNPRQHGQLSALTVTGVAGAEELRGTVEEQERLLRQRLNEARAGQKKTAAVRVEADNQLHWEQVVRVMDVCSKAGFKMSFVRPPDLGLSEQ